MSKKQQTEQEEQQYLGLFLDLSSAGESKTALALLTIHLSE